MQRMLSVGVLAMAAAISMAQVGGGAVYGQRQSAGGNAEANERAKRTVTKDDMPPNGTSMYLDASILLNVKADEYIALFGVSQEGATLDEARQKTDATIKQFTDDLKKLGVGASDVFVDFVAQNRIYGFEIAGDVAKEKLTGFEVKKNVAVHYRDKSLLDRCLEVAARAQIFDLIKVDYVVKDIDAVHARLMADASRVIKLKAANHGRLLGITLRPGPQVVAEKYSAYFPTEAYDSYSAYEAEDIQNGYLRQRLAVQGARKARTFYFNPLSAKSFDRVLNPVVIEPVVQFTLYLKVRFESGPGPAAKSVKAKSGRKARSH